MNKDKLAQIQDLVCVVCSDECENQLPGEFCELVKRIGRGITRIVEQTYEPVTEIGRTLPDGVRMEGE